MRSSSLRKSPEAPGSWLCPEGKGAGWGAGRAYIFRKRLREEERGERAAPFAGAGAGCLQHKYMQMYSASLALPGMGRYKQSQENIHLRPRDFACDRALLETAVKPSL